MAASSRIKSEERIMGSVPKGEMMLEYITGICSENNISIGRIEAIGSVTHLNIAFYDQNKREYLTNRIDKPLEIVSCIGNVSLKQGKPFVHAHISAADADGTCYGGHLGNEVPVFACEYIIHKYSGDPLIREYDDATGLTLWS